MSGLPAAAVSTVRASGKRAVELLAGVVARAQIEQVRRYSRRGADVGRIVALDIDNTIADSWPSFLVADRGHLERLSSIEPLPNVKAVAHDRPLSEGATVVFLSHRNLWEWPVTFRWLRRHGFAAHWWNVVLVPSPAAKVPLVRRLAPGREVTYWDDLSYGHETGTINFYAEVVDALAGVSLTYKGWDDIVTLSGLGLERD